MKTAVQYGAGNIGRGFMGQLFWEAGYKTIFVEYGKELVDKLNAAGKYPLRLLDAYTKKEIDMVIDRFEAVTTEEKEKAARAFGDADIAGTAVGVNNLDAIAPLVAAGITLRRMEKKPALDIYLCENIYGAGEMLKKAVLGLLEPKDAAYAEKNVGFVSTSVARMVPAPGERFKAFGPLFVVADSYHQLPYDKPAARAPEPAIEGIHGVSNFKAEVERKLYTHNLGHAALGYIGYLKGYTYVHEPFDDAFLGPIFDKALDETSEALLKMYPKDLDSAEHKEIRKDVRVRFGNPMIMDTVHRVARDPLRKLAPNDRLVGSAKLCLAHGVFPKNIAYICGAALHFDFEGDPAALKLQALIKEKGVKAALTEVSGVDAASPFGVEILAAYDDLTEKKKTWKK